MEPAILFGEINKIRLKLTLINCTIKFVVILRKAIFMQFLAYRFNTKVATLVQCVE